MSKRIILICGTDNDELFIMQEGLTSAGFEVVIIKDAAELVATAENLRPAVVIANPDMKNFNENDVCKLIKKEYNIPVMLLIQKNSTTRAAIGACDADDVVTKPVEIGNLTMLVSKHIALYQQ